MAVKNKNDAIKILADVTGDRRFFCQDGYVAKNLEELSACLAHMSQDVFSRHVHDSNNDFSNWIRDVLGDKTLADDLSGITERTDAAKMISGRIAWLRKKLN